MLTHVNSPCLPNFSEVPPVKTSHGRHGTLGPAMRPVTLGAPRRSLLRANGHGAGTASPAAWPDFVS